MSTSVAFNKVITMAGTQHDNHEMRLTGLILAQSSLIGAAVGIFDAGIWLPAGTTENHWVNGMTYAMGALAVQILAYYLFKMFFEQQMQEKVRVSEMQRQRDNRYRDMQYSHDQRRQDMELRMQEMELEKEMMWMQQNPGKAFPQFMKRGEYNSSNVNGLGVDYNSSATPPQVKSQTLSMGLDNMANQETVTVAPRLLDNSNDGVRYKSDGTIDKRFKKNR
jgi:hypothetical protein